MVLIGDTPVSRTELSALCDTKEQIAFSDNAVRRIEAGRAILEREAKAGRRIFGMNTGFLGGYGGFADRLLAEEFQNTIIRCRMAGSGQPLSERASRLALISRAISAATGATGLSLETAQNLLALLNARITPIVPTRGSVGVTDIGLMAHLVAPMIGRGEVIYRDKRMPASMALFDAGIAPIALAPHDGIGLINASSITAGFSACLMECLASLLTLSVGAAALCLEAYGANAEIFGEEVNQLRMASGQQAAAAMFRGFLEGRGTSQVSAAKSGRDAMSFRTVVPITGTLIMAMSNLAHNVEAEINGCANSPAVLLESDTISASPNVHTANIAIIADATRITLAHLSNALVNRIVKLMNPALSGLPRNLSPAKEPAAGYAALQRLASVLNAEIRHKANPASIDALAVFEGEEDSAPQTMFALSQLSDSIDLMFELVAMEALVATQAIDLREDVVLSPLTRRIHERVREVVQPLTDDREVGSDLAAALRALRNDAFIQTLNGDLGDDAKALVAIVSD